MVVLLNIQGKCSHSSENRPKRILIHEICIFSSSFMTQRVMVLSGQNLLTFRVIYQLPPTGAQATHSSKLSCAFITTVVVLNTMPKVLGGLLTRMAAKVTAHSMGMMVNTLLG